ncbi:hypothetical protein AB0C65_35790 [Nocardia sp. NPDC048505]|uniref:hypothetical protein n=1 Tax=Nocardia sp. NPDC048505 TaxID=3155756 RepID=UPI0033E60225
MADEEGWNEPTPIQRLRAKWQAWETVSPTEADELLCAPIPAACHEDAFKVQKAYIEYLRLIGDPQWEQRSNELFRVRFHWEDPDPQPWGPWREPVTALAQYLNALKFCDENRRVLVARRLRAQGAPAPVAADGREICRAWCQLRILIGDPRGPALLLRMAESPAENPSGKAGSG